MQSCYKPWYTNNESAYSTNTFSSIFYIRQKKVPYNAKKVQYQPTAQQKTCYKPWHDSIVSAYTIEYWTCFFYISAKNDFNHKKLCTEKYRLWITFFLLVDNYKCFRYSLFMKTQKYFSYENVYIQFLQNSFF